MRAWTPRTVLPDDIDRIVATLAAWGAAGGTGPALQVGDIGWLLRFGRERAAACLTEFMAPEGTTGLVMNHEAEADWWFAIDPALLHDPALATSLAEWIDQRASGGRVSVDGPHPPAAWRRVLAERGFEATTDTWAHLWMPLRPGMGQVDPAVVTTQDRANVPDRVAVQRAAFAGSTFNLDRWNDMARERWFDPRYDFLLRTPAGEPAAACTCWLPATGTAAQLEPMGTHPDHRRQGHGRRLLRSAATVLADAGAIGFWVVTPEANAAAVALYRAAGFLRIGHLTAMVRPGPPDAQEGGTAR